MPINEESMVPLHTEEHCGEFNYEFTIKARLGREVTKFEKLELNKIARLLNYAIARGFRELDPAEQERAKIEKLEILSCFGSQAIFTESIPNGYCSQGCCAFRPWFIVTTRVGRIKIGWRKSVINIDWSDSVIKKTGDEIFPNEEVYPGCGVTRWETGIHAHGYEKAKQYLAKLMEVGDGATLN